VLKFIVISAVIGAMAVFGWNVKGGQ